MVSVLMAFMILSMTHFLILGLSMVEEQMSSSLLVEVGALIAGTGWNRWNRWNNFGWNRWDNWGWNSWGNPWGFNSWNRWGNNWGPGFCPQGGFVGGGWAGNGGWIGNRAVATNPKGVVYGSRRGNSTVSSTQGRTTPRLKGRYSSRRKFRNKKYQRDTNRHQGYNG
jgi:hypothetical protein